MINACFARLRHERGAVLVHVTVAIIGLLAFSALVVDYGVMWTARRQAQNAADAAALAGAISMTFTKPGDFDAARATARSIGRQNAVFGLAPNITQGSGDSCQPIADDISFPSHGDTCGNAYTLVDGDRQCPELGSCVRVNVYRNTVKDALPTFFARLLNISTQGAQATATAEVTGGKRVDCMIPFAVMDRWADHVDPTPDTRFFTNDALDGIPGWTQNDVFEAPGDTYIPPYDGNTNTTGWTVTNDYGRQFVLKTGAPNQYSAGWFAQVDLPGSGGSSDYRWNIENCNTQPVGIADEDAVCDARDEVMGCMSIKTGAAQGPTVQGIASIVGYDTAAHWDWNATGPDGQDGAVVGGGGMTSPRIRPLVVLDIDHYTTQNGTRDCSGTGCLGKVANVIGFFVEGVCRDVTLDASMPACDDPNSDIVGRIVTLPGDYGRGGGVVSNASFVKVIRLIR